MRKALAVLALFLLASLPLALLLRDVSQVVVGEMLRMVWQVRLLVEGLPQLTLWGLLLAAVLLSATISLTGRTWRNVPRAGLIVEPPEEPGPPPGRVRELSGWLRRAATGRYSRWTVDRHLAILTWEILAFRLGRTPGELKIRFRAGELELPPAVAYVVERDPRRLRWRSRPGLWPILRRRRASPVPAALEDIVRFLEEQLEVADEHHPD